MGPFRLFRLVRRIVALGLLAIVVYLGVTFAQVWLSSRRDAARPADAIVVMGAAQYDGRPSPVLRARLDQAAALYDEGIAPLVVVTGGQIANDPSNNTEAKASADYLAREHSIPQDDILRENDACNTWDSLASASAFLRRDGHEKVVLVSDPFHSYRVAAMAGELHLDAAVSPTRTSPIGGAEEVKHLLRETAIVAVGRVVGFRNLMGVDDLRSEGDDCGSG